MHKLCSVAKLPEQHRCVQLYTVEKVGAYSIVLQMQHRGAQYFAILPRQNRPSADNHLRGSIKTKTTERPKTGFNSWWLQFKRLSSRNTPLKKENSGSFVDFLHTTDHFSAKITIKKQAQVLCIVRSELCLKRLYYVQNCARWTQLDQQPSRITRGASEIWSTFQLKVRMFKKC